jgi:hypothetical protein
MKSPVGRIVIFLLAGLAHAEGFHRGVGAVVGNSINNGITGPAVGTVYKWIAVPAVLRVENLVKAVFADGNVGRNKGRPFVLSNTLSYDKIPEVDGVKLLLFQAYDMSLWREGFRDELEECLDRNRIPFNLYLNAVLVVKHISFQAVRLSKVINVWAESHSLDYAFNGNPGPYEPFL